MTVTLEISDDAAAETLRTMEAHGVRLTITQLLSLLAEGLPIFAAQLLAQPMARAALRAKARGLIG